MKGLCEQGFVVVCVIQLRLGADLEIGAGRPGQTYQLILIIQAQLENSYYILGVSDITAFEIQFSFLVCAAVRLLLMYNTQNVYDTMEK